MTAAERDEPLKQEPEVDERERRSGRRNLIGILVVTFMSLALIIGDLIRDLLQR